MSAVEFRYNIEAGTPNSCNYFGGNTMLKTPTQSQLHELLNYNADTGIVTWKKKSNNKSNKIKIGMEAGYKDPASGYMVITIHMKVYRLHRLIWMYVHGGLPNNIDHINHNRSDNRLCNLRDVTKKENNRNVTKRSDNTSGKVGVSWSKQAKKWDARITVDGKFISLGTHHKLEDAILVRKEAEIKYGFHKNHGRCIK